METHRTLSEAREAKHAREAGDRRPTGKISFEGYFAEWIESYAGRTERGSPRRPDPSTGDR